MSCTKNAHTATYNHKDERGQYWSKVLQNILKKSIPECRWGPASEGCFEGTCSWTPCKPSNITQPTVGAGTKCPRCDRPPHVTNMLPLKCLVRGIATTLLPLPPPSRQLMMRDMNEAHAWASKGGRPPSPPPPKPCRSDCPFRCNRSRSPPPQSSLQPSCNRQDVPPNRFFNGQPLLCIRS